METVPCAIYARISKDKKGEERGVGRQADDCRELISRHPEWYLDDRPYERGGRLYVDNDISAMSGKRRPAYEALMNAVDRREVLAVVVYMQSRLWRNRRDRADGLDRFRKARARLEIVKGQSVDMTKAMDRGMVALLGEFDTLEGEIKGERQQAQIAESAALGAWHGHRPFGYRLTVMLDGEGHSIRTLEPDPVEAAALRAAVIAVIEGRSLYSIMVDWHGRGIKGTRGGRIDVKALRRILIAPRNAGIREYAPGWKGGPRLGDVHEYRASWPALISPDELDAVRQILLDPGRARGIHPRARIHLLAGWVRCGRCEGPMYAAPREGRIRYSCRAAAYGGCGGMERIADGIETTVLQRVFHWLEDNGLYDQARAAIEDDEVKHLRERRRTALARRTRFDDHLADETWDKPTYMRQVRRVDAELDLIDRELARHVGDRVLDTVPERGSEFVRRWREWERDGARGLDRRREVLAALIDRVVVHPAPPGPRAYDIRRVQVFPGSWADMLLDPTAAQPPPVPDLPLDTNSLILRALAAEPDRLFSISELAQVADIHPVTCQTRLKALIDAGRVARTKPPRQPGRPGGLPYLYKHAGGEGSDGSRDRDETVVPEAIR